MSNCQCNQSNNWTSNYQCNQSSNCTCNNYQCNQNNSCNTGGCAGTTISGGWCIDIKCPTSISPSLYTCFTNALNSQVGINYTILRYLGYQIVSGTNYALLCSGTTVTNPPTTQLYVVIIYKDLNGNCSILSSTPVLGIAG